MKNMLRSIRRHHYARLKKTRQYYWGHNKKEGYMTPKQAGEVTQTPCMCSSYCCGNPRRHFKTLTLQEYRHLDKAKLDKD